MTEREMWARLRDGEKIYCASDFAVDEVCRSIYSLYQLTGQAYVPKKKTAPCYMIYDGTYRFVKEIPNIVNDGECERIRIVSFNGFE